MEFRRNSWKLGMKISAQAVIALFLLCTPALAVTEINNITFRVEGDQSILELSGSGPMVFQKTENPEGRQVVIDIESARLTKAAARKLDTSSFNSVVSLVSPYQIDQGGGTARIVMQLRAMSSAEVSQDGNKLIVRMANGGTSTELPPDSAPGSEAVVDAPPQQVTQSEPQTPGDSVSAQPRAKKGQTMSIETTQAQAKDNIDLFLQNQKSKNFRGKAVTLQVRDAEVKDILRLIADSSGFNIVLGQGISGKLTLSLVDVPWDQALDVILQTLKLGAERNNNVLRILTLQNLTSQKQEELAAKQAQEATAPKITRVFSINYAKPEELSSLLTTFGKGSSGASTATVSVDKRTNSIVVQDIADNIDRMAKLVELLDTQTPQVLIEAKVVEATENFSRALNGNFGVGSASASIGPYAMAFNGGSPFGALAGGATGNTTFSGASASGGAFGFSPVLSFLPGSASLNAFISFSETKSDVKVVSAPKTVVLNKESSTITQTTPILFSTTTVVDGGSVTSFEQADAILKLDVTPTVTNDEGVLLDLKITRDVPQNLGSQQAIAKRDMKTKVLVQSGSTLVIGGIYTMDATSSSGGFPWLMDIPILGALFKSDTSTTSRTELFIFVTPKVINSKKAGLSG